MISTIKRIKWKNIMGLLLFIAIVFAVVWISDAARVALFGDCVEKDGIKVCFTLADRSIGRSEATEITTDITNTGNSVRDAVIRMRVSPNLEALGESRQAIEAFAPGDTVRRSFRVGARKEIGEFSVDFDINSDTQIDKSMRIIVR